MGRPNATNTATSSESGLYESSWTLFYAKWRHIESIAYSETATIDPYNENDRTNS